MSPARFTYRCYTVELDRPPIPSRAFDWSYVHPDYTGNGDHRHGYAATAAAACDAIDELYRDEAVKQKAN